MGHIYRCSWTRYGRDIARDGWHSTTLDKDNGFTTLNVEEMFLPTTNKEVEARGWDELDVIIFSGDAYIDHPAFGPAVIGRILEAEGYRVAIVPQPNWRDDLRDFKKLGKPRLFFAVTAGAMDSMVNHYTANIRLRSNDAYTPGGKAGFRPDRCPLSVVCCPQNVM